MLQPGPGEVLVKVPATAINPSDVTNVSRHFESSMPRVSARDYAGTIVLALEAGIFLGIDMTAWNYPMFM